MAHWERLGRIYAGGDGPVWMNSHASVPFLIPLGEAEALSRVYFTPRDEKNRSQIAWIDLDLNDPLKILAMSDSPLLNFGERGCFDDCGTMTSWIVPDGSIARHYFIGWNVRNTVPFHNSIGLALVSEGRGIGEPPQVDKKFVGPVLDRSMRDPFFCSNPCVMKDGDQWLMWYISGIGWLEGENGKAARYVVKLARSDDGLSWTVSSDVTLGLQNEDEVALARPSVLRDEAGWHMWFSYRGRSQPYKIGYAFSSDGQTWHRDDARWGFDVGREDWNSEMVCYPHVFKKGSEFYMLYCGNDYGKSGFGLAVWIN